MSTKEASKYLTSNYAQNSRPTKYAEARKGFRSHIKWWLRSPSSNQKYAALLYYGKRDSDEVTSICGIRPALWVNLESGIFKSYIETGSWE